MRSVDTSYYIMCGNKTEYLDYDSSSLGSDDRRHSEYESITIPKSCETGTAHIFIWIDDKKRVKRFTEINEDNNIDLVKIRIR